MDAPDLVRSVHADYLAAGAVMGAQNAGLPVWLAVTVDDYFRRAG